MNGSAAGQHPGSPACGWDGLFRGVLQFKYYASQDLIEWPAERAAELLGIIHAPDPACGGTLLRHILDEDRFMTLARIERALQRSEEMRVTYRWQRPSDGELRYLLLITHPVSEPQGAVLHGIIIDLTAELVNHSRARRELRNLDAFLACSSAMLILLDPDLLVCGGNFNQFPEWCGFGDPQFRHDLLKTGASFLNCFSARQPHAAVAEPLADIISGRRVSWSMRTANALGVPLSIEALPIQEGDELRGILLRVEDDSPRVRLEGEVAGLRALELTRALSLGITTRLQSLLQDLLALERDPRPAGALRSRLLRDASALCAELAELQESGERPGRADLAAVLTRVLAQRRESLPDPGALRILFGNIPAVGCERAAVETLLAAAADELLPDCLSAAEPRIATVCEPSPHRERYGPRAAAVVFSTVLSPEVPEQTLVKGYNRLLARLMPYRPATNSTGYAELGSGAALAYREREGRSEVAIFFRLHDDLQGRRKPVDTAASPRVLIVDDDTLLSETIAALLHEAGLSSIVAGSAAEAFSLARRHRRTLGAVLLEPLACATDARSATRRLSAALPSATIFLFSGAAEQSLRPLMVAGAHRILAKPIDPLELIAELQKALAVTAESEKNAAVSAS